MSASEIADNKWETEASKPQLKTAASLSQMLRMSGFMLFFVYILLFSVIGMFSEDKGNALEAKFSHMNDATDEAPAEAKPEE